MAARKLWAVAEGARIAALPWHEAAASLAPRALDLRSAALGLRGPTRGSTREVAVADGISSRVAPRRVAPRPVVDGPAPRSIDAREERGARV